MNNQSRTKLRDTLHWGLQQLGEDPLRHPCQKYLAFLDLLCDWNRAYNLTALRSREDMLIRHILDSLTVLPYIRGGKCLDVATGAGLPGLILALCQPARQWTLLDSSIKKIRFLNQAVMELQPENIDIVRARIEDFDTGDRFDTVITRAYASLIKFHRNTESLLNKDGILIAMKGRMPEAELNELTAEHIKFDLHKVTLPASDAVRHIVVLNN